jgi:hypothetical protein
MYWVFDDPTLIVGIASCIMAPTIVFLILLWRCPEALAFLKCQLTGGVMISVADESGQNEFVVAKSKGQGLYISGSGFRHRRVFRIPHFDNPSFSKRFLSKGIHRPIFFAGNWKITAVNPEALAAIELADDKSKRDEKKSEIPENVRKWAETQHVQIEVKEPDKILEIADPTGAGSPSREITEGALTEQTETLLTMDPRKLRDYFEHDYDGKQVDNLLEEERLAGQISKGGGFHVGKGLIIAFLIMGVGAIILIVILSGAVKL